MPLKSLSRSPFKYGRRRTSLSHMEQEESMREEQGRRPTLLRRNSLSSSFSLGVGSLTTDGLQIASFKASPSSLQSVCGSYGTIRSNSKGKDYSNSSQRGGSLYDYFHQHKPTVPVIFRRNCSSFFRVADLDLEIAETNTSCTASSIASDEEGNNLSAVEDSHPNFTYAAVDPPPGVEHDPQERWVALDDGSGSHAPVAPYAVQALAKTGIYSSLNESMWTPYSQKQIKNTPWHARTWQDQASGTLDPANLPPKGSNEESQVLIWSGRFDHGLYGSDLPAIRAAGFIHMSPKSLCELLVDSSRVKEYNKLSLGREDLLVLQDDMSQDGPFGRSVTKVMRSKSTPPLIRKTMEFVSLLHARELEHGAGYLLVTRAVTHPGDHSSSSCTPSNVLRSEILMGVNMILGIAGENDRCLMINVCHIRSPMVPMAIANRIGASAAANFIKDLRSVC